MAADRAPSDDFTPWFEDLRARDTEFALASLVHPSDMGEWQAGVYLLTACDPLWQRVNAQVIEARSLAPVSKQLENPSRAWSASETDLMVWALHFWDINRYPAAFPISFQASYFQRWIEALYLRASRAPSPGS